MEQCSLCEKDFANLPISGWCEECCNQEDRVSYWLHPTFSCESPPEQTGVSAEGPAAQPAEPVPTAKEESSGLADALPPEKPPSSLKEEHPHSAADSQPDDYAPLEHPLQSVADVQREADPIETRTITILRRKGHNCNKEYFQRVQVWWKHNTLMSRCG